MPSRLEALALSLAFSFTIAVSHASAASDATNARSATTPIPVSTQSSEAQRSACTPDVFRLCGQYIPDVDGIVGCLKLQRTNLSPACRAVMR
jgi:hypothetical protein